MAVDFLYEKQINYYLFNYIKGWKIDNFFEKSFFGMKKTKKKLTDEQEYIF